jgi:hypothetical protein
VRTQDVECLLTVEREPWTDADFATRNSRRGLSLTTDQSRLCTVVDIRWKRPRNSHFFSLFGPAGVTSGTQSAISKSFHAKQIRADSWSCRASKTPCGTPNPKFSYRFPLIVHYVRPKSPSQVITLDGKIRT